MPRILQINPSRRSILLDFLRGVCLMVMTIDHLPQTLFSRITWQGLGFFSAAEGFIFLSGLVVGQVYGRIAITQGLAVVRQRALRRAAFLYFTNVALMSLLFLAAIGEFVTLGRGYQPSWSLWGKTMLCLAAPAYSDILPMYCIFLLLVPAVLWALINGWLHYVVAASAGLWLGASQGYGMAALPGSGYFDVLSWQLLFVAGTCFGFTRVRKPEMGKQEVSTPAWLTAVCFAVVGTFLVLRRWHFLTGQPLPAYFEWLYSWRRTLTLGRLLDFAAFSTLVYGFRRSFTTLAGTSPGQAVAFLGKHSLQVFIWSVVVTNVFYKSGRQSVRDHAIACTMVVLASCFVPAWLHCKWQARRRKFASFDPNWTNPASLQSGDAKQCTSEPALCFVEGITCGNDHLQTDS